MAKRPIKLPPMPWQGKGKNAPTDPEKEREARKLMLMLLGNSVLIIAAYFVFNALQFAPIFFIYMGISALLILIYVIYNRGFVYKNVTVDMLPDTLSDEQKRAVLDNAARRLRDSRWMLTLILPFVLAFMLDALYLFLLEDLFISLGLI